MPHTTRAHGPRQYPHSLSEPGPGVAPEVASRPLPAPASATETHPRRLAPHHALPADRNPVITRLALNSKQNALRTRVVRPISISGR